jgi:hypothetical protein
MTNADTPITSFDFGSGPLRGTHLTLFPDSLMHRGGGFLETIPLHALAGIRVAFERNERQLVWGGVLALIALILALLSGPLASLSGGAANEVAAQVHGAQGVAALVVAAFRFFETCARLLPLVAAALVLLAAALFALSWYGMTTLTLTLGAVEREYPVRGRNAMLYEFAEAASERLLLARR